MTNETSFTAYWHACNVAMLELFGIDTVDAGIEEVLISNAMCDGDTPEDFALWFGDKYGLTLVSEWKAPWVKP
jgi:hypothetical protein